MPDTELLNPKRTIELDSDSIDPPPRAPFVELGLVSCFSFLRGASDAVDLVLSARSAGYDAIGIADVNSMAGVVRIHTEAQTLKLRPVIGTRIETVEGLAFLAYPRDRAAYGRVCRLISAGRMATLEGEWQAKGECDISLAMLAEHSEEVQLILLPPDDLAQRFTIKIESNIIPFRHPGLDPGSRFSSRTAPEEAGPRLGDRGDEKVVIEAVFPDILPHLTRQLPTLRHLAASYLYRGDDIARIDRLDTLAKANNLTLLATNNVHYHAPERRPLQDVMTAIRHKTTVARAGHLLHGNAERYLKPPETMVHLFARWPHAIAAAREVADACNFSLEELKYEYPQEIYPDGMTPQQFLEKETWKGTQWRYPNGLPDSVRETLQRELALIAKLDLARYFLTIKDIVDYARSVDPPILCQGRGSAANSAVCFVLGITSVDPAKHQLLFDRFISEERKEPPDIDVDFEHERREEVIQHIYRKYGRHRAGLTATVIHYRPRMAIREVGKAMGLSEDVTSALARTVWGGWGKEIGEGHVAETGMDVADPQLRRVLTLTRQMIGMPRHLSQHVGGFILTEGALTETVPIGNGAMPDRSFIEWDKDDIEALGILKVDVLALGMLTCIKKCLDLLENHHERPLELATVPREDPETYAMLRKGDSLGVFQVESRAQMNMLPRLRPREFYDLVIQVAIVRPGPIQGDMVHPYLKRRRGEEKVVIPAPSPEHGAPDELSSILERTLGVPIFQEQAMKIALDAARFSSIEANRLRKAMATFRSRGMVDELQDMMVERMVTRGYDREFAERCFNQIRGFGEYGFPESHAASFAHLVYVSSWLKCHFPAAFACALLNSQPMGFYAPAQIVRDAAEHGVEVLPADVNCSQWDCTLEVLAEDFVSRRERRGKERRREGVSADEPHSSCYGASSEKVADCESAFGTDDISASPFPLRSLRETSNGANHDKGRLDKHIALRLGLRQVDGLPEHVAAQMLAERDVNGPFTDVRALRDRAGIGPAHVERLASADCFTSMGLPRRQALWDARSLVAGPDLPLFRAAAERDEGAERKPTMLPAMPLSEEVVADYQTTRLSLKAHPMAFLRPELAERGFVRACDLRDRKFRSMVQVAGVVLIRQRPGSAKGVCFITLEDETGVINLVVWPDLKEKQRKVVMGSRLMEVRGRVEYDDEVIHVIAHHMTDATHQLAKLSDDMLKTPIARADHVNNPLPDKLNPRDDLREGGDDPYQPVEPWQEPPPGNRECGYHQGHPRDVRIIPKSRDFH
ncbi:error-prone DNA polymerase [Erythrobacter litoralis]|uniref:Error-prone DNA polymerase n=1 Tax=Erythrobacter litoralis (strain HTCC2594) TaxID=314225 RepID=Q2NAX1_ERYLH|nr:error-prone DNA polymerase [Erythrobacter litoralis]ABC63170.1 DNA polymerase III alpha chain [Erythrobacter litoralis HTCC2594]